MLKLEQLNDSQRQAVMHGEGPLLVLAGPGSGKTFTITQRIFYLIEEQKVPPEEILVITFTKEAALSMQHRFLEESNQPYPVSFGTFHSVFYHILKQSQAAGSISILKENKKRQMILSALKQTLSGISRWDEREKKESMTEDANRMLAAISFYKNTGDLDAAKGKLSEEWKIHFEAVLKKYEQQRKHIHAIDFDDMISDCERLLRQNSDMRKYWQNRFSHILMDEFQDINPVQYQVITLLTIPPYNLFAVGDDDQAIYGFRGAKPSCLKQFAQQFQARQLLLQVNYRSYPEIVKASLAVINENKDRFVKQLEACKENTKKAETLKQACEIVSLKSFVHREEQYDYLLNQLEQCEMDSGAVLFRANTYMQSFALRLQREGIAFEMKEKGNSIYENNIAKDIFAYMRIAAGEQSRELFLQIINKPLRYISREALQEENVTMDGIRRYYEKHNPQWASFEFREKIQNSIQRLEKHLKFLKEAKPFLAIQYIRKMIGYEKYLTEESLKQKNGSEHLEVWLEQLDFLSEDAKNYQSLRDWMEAQKRYKKMLSEQGTGERNSNKIQLMTVHASKGLEFDRVWIPDCNEKNFPHGTPDKEGCEEERRIFYVAMSRAKKSLELLYLTGTKERPRLPSRFLKPLLPTKPMQEKDKY